MKQYITKAEVAELLQSSKITAGGIIREMQLKHIGPGKRYDEYAIVGQGKLLLVRYAVLMDYMRYREWLNDSDTVGIVPAFDLDKVERNLGVTSTPEPVNIDIKALGQEIARGLAEGLKVGI